MKCIPPGIKVLEPGQKYALPLKDGYLEIVGNYDPLYPGLDVEYITENSTDPKYKSNPRVLLETPAIDEDENDFGELRMLVWNDRNKEDYTEEIQFPDT